MQVASEMQVASVVVQKCKHAWLGGSSRTSSAHQLTSSSLNGNAYVHPNAADNASTCTHAAHSPPAWKPVTRPPSSMHTWRAPDGRRRTRVSTARAREKHPLKRPWPSSTSRCNSMGGAQIKIPHRGRSMDYLLPPLVVLIGGPSILALAAWFKKHLSTCISTSNQPQLIAWVRPEPDGGETEVLYGTLDLSSSACGGSSCNRVGRAMFVSLARPWKSQMRWPQSWMARRGTSLGIVNPNAQRFGLIKMRNIFQWKAPVHSELPLVDCLSEMLTLIWCRCVRL
jgi:hypothetical protein